MINTSTDDKSNSLPLKEKAAYAAPNFTLTLIPQVASYYLLYFFMNVANIQQNAAWIIMLAFSLFDAFTDAFSGFYLQKKAKPERFRLHILWTALPLAIFSVLLFSSPALPLAAKITYYILVYCIWNSVVSFLNISYLSTLPAMTQNNSERAKLNSFRIAVSVITVLMVSSATMPMVNFFGNSNEAKGFLITMIIFASLGLISQLFSFKYYKARYPVMVQTDKTPVLKSISVVLKDKISIFMLLMYFCISIANAFRNQTTVFYISDILHKSEFISLFFFITIGICLLMQFIIPPLIKRISIETAALTGILGCILSMLFAYLAGENVILFFTASFFFSMFSAFPANLIFLMLAKNVDRFYQKHKKNLSSTAYSLLSFFAKIGGGIGSTVSAVILNITGYSSQNADQSSFAVFGIKLIHIIIPAAGFSAALIFILFYMFFLKKIKKSVKI